MRRLLFTRRLHAGSAWLLLFALLFSQAALAAYRCPLEISGNGAASTPPCHLRDPGHARQASALCSAHCDPQSASTDHARLAPLLACALPALPCAAVMRARAATPVIAHGAPAQHANAPPIPIRFRALLF